MEKISRISRRTITSILQKISNVIVTNDFKSCKKHLQKANSCKKYVAHGQRICFEDNLFFENTHLEQNFVSDISIFHLQQIWQLPSWNTSTGFLYSKERKLLVKLNIQNITLYFISNFFNKILGDIKWQKKYKFFFHMYTITSDYRLGSRRTCTNSIILPSFILSLGTMLHDFVNKLYAKCIILVSKSVAKCFNVIFSNLSHSKMPCNVKCALLFTTKVYIRVT